MTIYMCEDSFEGMLCGVYDAWTSRKGHSQVKLGIKDQGESLELFCDYVDVPEDGEKAEKVIRSIREKISEEAYEAVYKASLSMEKDRADRIYRFLIYGFHVGAGITDMLQIPAVCDIFEMCRYVGNEAHLTTEFLRFSEMEGNLLVSRIGPKNDVLVLIAPHFADRLSGENFMIYDEKRGKAVIHPAMRPWAVVYPSSEEWKERLTKAVEEDVYKVLWKAFRKSVTIRERINPRCQMNHLPLRYRPYMTEFEDGIRDV